MDMYWKDLLYILQPLLLHMAIFQAAALLSERLGTFPYAAALATIAANVCLFPFLIWMDRLDRKKGRGTADRKPSAAFPKASEPVAAYESTGHPLFRRRAAMGVLCFMLGGCCSLGFGKLMEWLSLLPEGISFQQDLLSAPPLWQILGFGLLTPVTEEFLYRGLFYRRMRTFLPAWICILLTSGIFALSHGNVVLILYAFPMGILMAGVMEKTDSLMTPAAVHCGANLAALVYSLAIK